MPTRLNRFLTLVIKRFTIRAQMSGLSEIELLNLDEKGNVPKESRLKDVASALSIYETLRRADESSAVNRARIQAVFDGRPPYSDAALRASGQASRANLNFGEAARLLDTAMSGYVDLISSVENLVTIETKNSSENDGMRVDTIISEELSRTLRGWPEFHSTFLRLCNEFITHGVGVTFFENETDFRFRTCGIGDMLLPRQTQSSEHSVEVAVSRRDYMVHELYNFIRNPEAAEAVGWNVEAVKKAIQAANSGAHHKTFTNWEDTQREIKNNDIYTGIRANSVPVLHFFVREFDGSVSHFMAADVVSAGGAKEESREFLYKRVSRYENPEQAFLFFTYGVGTNGTLHSIRGLGHRIFNHVQTSNRLRCQMVDGAMLASSVMLQPDSQRALDELALQYYGPYAVLSPNIKLVEKAMPNMTQTVMPALADMTQQLNEATGFYASQNAAGGSYRSKLQVEADLEVATRLTSANLNLFYASFSRLVREIARRIVTGPKSDPAVRDFYERCMERGVPANIVKSVDHRKTRANKAIGSGNAAARSSALNELDQLLPMLDEQGKKNLVYDRIASRVGYEMAGRYAVQPENARPTVENKVAELENVIIMSGTPVSVQPTELHETHLTIHLPKIQELLEGISSGQIDPMQVLQSLQLLLQHVSQHEEVIVNDPTAEVIAGQAREVINNAGNVVQNFQRKLEAEQRKAQDTQAQPQDPQAQQAAEQQDAQLAQAKAQTETMLLDLKKQKAQLDLEIKRAKFEQDTAIKDAKLTRDFQQQ